MQAAELPANPTTAAPTLSATTSDGRVLISQGAEARVYSVLRSLPGHPEPRRAILKQRFKKNYRHPSLDKSLTRSRIRAEARCLTKFKETPAEGVNVPELYHVDFDQSAIYLEYIPGITVKAALLENLFPQDIQHELVQRIGKTVASLHNSNIVHGDLTTSNMLLRDRDPTKIVLIDFGLSYNSTTPIEDKGVDLYVLERAFLSTHPQSESLFQLVLDAYAKHATSGPAIITRLNEVRLRGRKKMMVG
ncbi:protein serine/threonine kinase [Capsaspora owczarzaki ATCC 30864]|uniref:protein serine/threonine kinase n=1 Tax=Capsaspora owczarzaki (strain ATCC 30864) TaxID=595528 RepID=UPI0003526494|nr:protein serine/threonine kinase [Capsaspora owczarzaki ATCC 30864]|eukprot:XP_004348295.2 protein serine/threonine kinase [Capsaspora owczarzaki ATCC 30864]